MPTTDWEDKTGGAEGGGGRGGGEGGDNTVTFGKIRHGCRDENVGER